jgi:hypothetical protein
MTIMIGLAAAVLSVMSVASPAVAETRVKVSMSFTEQEFTPTCSLSDEYYCGRGVMLPYGNATENIHFGGGCNGSCDLRTITVASGTLMMNEFLVDVTCLAPCETNGRGEPISATFHDVIVGGTGVFSNASGSLDGKIIAAGNTSTVKFGGTILLG